MTAHRIKPTVPEVLPLVRAHYDHHSAGCCLHVVLDDGNVADAFMPGTEALARERGHKECAELAALLSQMSPTQRRKLVTLRMEAEGPRL
jgi:hypothetical protein